MKIRDIICEISPERLERYLSRADQHISRRMEKMVTARERLNKGYEIYYADDPTKIVDKFEADTPALAQQYYQNYIDNYVSDVDFDLRLRKSTGLTESFDQPYPIKWEQGDHGDYDALAKLDDGTNLSIMFNDEGDDEVQIEFYRNNSQEVTGAGDAQRVFATVLEAIQQYLKFKQPWRFIFSASKDVEPGQNSQSRASLYDRLIQRYASAWGYDTYHEDHGDQVTYELTRKKQLQNPMSEKVV